MPRIESQGGSWIEVNNNLRKATKQNLHGNNNGAKLEEFEELCLKIQKKIVEKPDEPILSEMLNFFKWENKRSDSNRVKCTPSLITTKDKIIGILEIQNLSNVFISYKILSTLPELTHENMDSIGPRQVIRLKFEWKLTQKCAKAFDFVNERFVLLVYPIYHAEQIQEPKLRVLWKLIDQQCDLLPANLLEKHEFTFGCEYESYRILKNFPFRLPIPFQPTEKKVKCFGNGEEMSPEVQAELLRGWAIKEENFPYIPRAQIEAWTKAVHESRSEIEAISSKIKLFLAICLLIPLVVIGHFYFDFIENWRDFIPFFGYNEPVAPPPPPPPPTWTQVIGSYFQWIWPWGPY